MKICRKCKEVKELLEYHRVSKGKDGVKSICKSCSALEMKAYRTENKYKLKESRKEYVRANKEKIRDYMSKYFDSNRDPKKIYDASYHLSNREEILERKKEYRHTNREKILEGGKKYREKNKDKIAVVSRNWQLKNTGAVNAISANRRSNKLKATPVWADQEKIKDMYSLASRFSRIDKIPYHVDHIVPLKSKFVCGLHCKQNLRILPARENQKKSNTYYPGVS